MSTQLIVHGAEAYPQALRRAEQFIDAHDASVFITTNRPVDQLVTKATFPDATQFVDCISHMAGILTPPPRTTLIDSPVLLEKMGLRSMQMLRRMPGNRALVLDNLSTLMLYNSMHEVVGITTSILDRCQTDGVDAILIVTSPGNEELIGKVSSLVDSVETVTA